MITLRTKDDVLKAKQLREALGPDGQQRFATEFLRAAERDPDSPVIRELALFAWGFTPDIQRDTKRWASLFRHLGFTSDRPGEQAPVRPVTAWRGVSTIHGPRGMPWSTVESRAHAYAVIRSRQGEHATVYKAEIPPEAILAHYHWDGVLVVDPSSLDPDHIRITAQFPPNIPQSAMLHHLGSVIDPQRGEALLDLADVLEQEGL